MDTAVRVNEALNDEELDKIEFREQMIYKKVELIVDSFINSSKLG